MSWMTRSDKLCDDCVGGGAVGKMKRGWTWSWSSA